MNLIFKVRTSILNIREQPATNAKVLRQVISGALISSPASESRGIREGRSEGITFLLARHAP